MIYFLRLFLISVSNPIILLIPKNHNQKLRATIKSKIMMNIKTTAVNISVILKHLLFGFKYNINSTFLQGVNYGQ
jgi:hypothetical protein